MFLATGIVMAALALSAFVYSLPRGGKVAPFVGTQWGGLCRGFDNWVLCCRPHPLPLRDYRAA